MEDVSAIITKCIIHYFSVRNVISDTINIAIFLKIKESVNHVICQKTIKQNVHALTSVNYVVLEVSFTFLWTNQITLIFFVCWSMAYGNFRTLKLFFKKSTYKMLSKISNAFIVNKQTPVFINVNVVIIIHIHYVLMCMDGT